MPAQPPGVWGIDLGQCGLKAIRLQEIDGQIVATAFDYVEHPKILSQPDADPDQLTREALDKFLSRNSLRGDIVAISVPGQSGLARFVKLPPVEEKKIADIVRFEAKQQIPFNLEEVVWDYQKIGSGIVTDGFAMETEIGLFAMKRDMVNRYLQHFKDVGVEVHLVQMAPLALCNYVAYDLLGKDALGGASEGADRKNCVVALDIGADSSNLVITDGERIIWQRPIPLGGNHFTRALTKDLKLTFAKAEHLKRNATKSPDLKKILAALKPVLNDFVGEVQRSLGYFTNTHRDAHIEYMVGLGNAFRLPGLQKFLSEKLQLDVRKLGKMERVSGDQVVAQQVYTENVLTFAVAYGLALQGLKRARLLTNLLPGEIRVERLVKAKKPFAVAAAAALLLACGGLALSYALEYRTYGSKRVTDAVEEGKRVAGVAKKAADKFASTVKKAKDEEEAVKTIVAGQFERDNWLELLKFINTAIPRPDGQPHEFLAPGEDEKAIVLRIPNLPNTPEAKKYWSEDKNHPAQKAYMEYLARQLSGPVAKDESSTNGSDDLPPGIENLVQFNIESVDGFFCDNLHNFWDQVRGKGGKVKEEGSVRPQSDFAKYPEGAGWVIEIQGWTYHKDAETFVRNTLLQNLADLGIQRGTAAPPAKDAAPADAKTAPAPAGTAGQQTPAADNTPLPDLGPVINRISHVVLYDHAQSSGAFKLLGQNHVRALASAGAAGTGKLPGMIMGGGAGMMGAGGAGMGSGGAGMMGAGGAGAGAGGAGGEEKTAPTGPSRDTWQPLAGSSSGGTGVGMMGGGAGMMGGAGAPKGMMGGGAGAGGAGSGSAGMLSSGSRPPMGMKGGAFPGSGSMPPPGGVAPGATPPTTHAGAESSRPRTEFVILLVWKEPTPSDALRGQAAPGSTDAQSTTQSSTPTKEPPFKPRRRARYSRPTQPEAPAKEPAKPTQPEAPAKEPAKPGQPAASKTGSTKPD